MLLNLGYFLAIHTLQQIAESRVATGIYKSKPLPNRDLLLISGRFGRT
jgi:hypothetical protein